MAPPRLRAGLVVIERVHDGRLAELDERVLGSARRRRARQRVMRRWAYGLTAAAGLAVAVWGGLLVSARLGMSEGGHVASGSERRGSADGARTGTILDAYALARAMRDGRSLGASWDINGDGEVNQRDVDELARRAVRVSGGSGAGAGGERMGGA